MAETTAIEWADSTFNPWRGCTKVSSGCLNCYAERKTLRYGLDFWGKDKPRPRTGAKYWKEPYKWNDEAQAAGVRRRVFCASFADVCEDRPDLVEARRDLQILIEMTPQLDWLLLTKRPENFNRLFARWNGAGGWPPNAWAGTSVENQAAAASRIPELVKVPAPVRFLSVEPLLAPVDLVSYLWMPRLHGQGPGDLEPAGQIHWVIVGGESGPNSRPMHEDWVRALRDQCTAAGVAFFFKQWGEFVPIGELKSTMVTPSTIHRACLAGDGQSGTPGHWAKVGKKAAGYELDGRTWTQFPEEPQC